jgi:hypothetical protein
MMRIQLVAFVMLGAVATACSPTTYNYTDSGHSVTAYLPYLESVDLPDEVRVSENYQVTLHFSSELNPDLLRGITAPDWTGVVFDPQWILAFPSGTPLPSPVLGKALHPWVTNPPFAGEIADGITLNLSFNSSQTGTYTLRIHTADSREWGGLETEFVQYSAARNIPTHPHAVYREYTFTVLPAEE